MLGLEREGIHSQAKRTYSNRLRVDKKKNIRPLISSARLHPPPSLTFSPNSLFHHRCSRPTRTMRSSRFSRSDRNLQPLPFRLRSAANSWRVGLRISTQTYLDNSREGHLLGFGGSKPKKTTPRKRFWNTLDVLMYDKLHGNLKNAMMGGTRKKLDNYTFDT